ncbi:type III-A CRISPR-associated RAMP protein Csm4 [Thermovenabulum sp.]|uniref:type III-A CRISPR-associated RAMP protein Csm4 n=1 Tax=Thermovenabulum sp. TaxID=3100335 RepID=UPI003C7C2916
MKKYRVKLKFKGPVHFGYKEKMDNLSESIVHSDTIFSGIMCCYNLLYGKEKADKLAKNFINGVYLFENSSAFIYVNDDYLLPRPLNLDLFGVIEDYKKAKKVKFISESILERLSNRRQKGGNEEKVYGYIKGKFFLKEPYEGEIIAEKERPRVVLDRLNFNSNIYYVSSSLFDENSGLWFYLKVDTSIEKEILASIRLLGDEGIGGERTYGFGFFEPDFIEDKEKEKHSEEYLLLSLFYPAEEDDLENALISYDLTERGGYVYSIYQSDIKKNRSRMLTEGSVFKRELKGKVVDITPEGFEEHRVLKYGAAFLKPF